MANEKKKTDGQFGDLPMGSMIGSPLKAALEAQETLAEATAGFLGAAGFSGGGGRRAKAVDVPFAKQVVEEDGTMKAEKTVLQVPVLTVIPVPAFSVEEMNIAFGCEVKFSVGDGTGKRPEPAKRVVKTGYSPIEVTDSAVSSDETAFGSGSSTA